MAPSALENRLGLIALSLRQHAQLMREPLLTSPHQSGGETPLQAGIKALDQWLEEAAMEEGFGSTSLPDGTSWVETLAQLDWNLAWWWLQHATQPWAHQIQETTLAERLVQLAYDTTPYKHIPPACELVVAASFTQGLPLTQHQGEEWTRHALLATSSSGLAFPSHQEKHVERAHSLAQRVIMLDDMAAVPGPLLRAYVAAGAPLVFARWGHLCSFSSTPRAQDGSTLDKILGSGFPLDGKVIGSTLPWWEASVYALGRDDRQKLLAHAQAQGLNTQPAQRFHIAQNAIDIFTRQAGPPRYKMEAMVAYLKSTPEGLSATFEIPSSTHETRDCHLVWQSAIQHQGAGATVELVMDPSFLPEMDRGACTQSSSLLNCALMMGNILHMEPRHAKALLEIAPLMKGQLHGKWLPNLENMFNFTRGSEAPSTGVLTALLEKHGPALLDLAAQKEWANKILRVYPQGISRPLDFLHACQEGLLAQRTLHIELFLALRMAHLLQKDAGDFPGTWPMLEGELEVETESLLTDMAQKLDPEAYARWVADLQHIRLNRQTQTAPSLAGKRRI